jgi:5'-3' exonuclease
MGIPSYFSYIVKQHREIIKKINSSHFIKINNLYIDSNSIVYDIVNELNNKSINITNNLIIDLTFEKIKEYIKIINPTNNVLIAFDGVAPVAKLKQQRRRRYLSWFQTELLNKLKSEENSLNCKNINNDETMYSKNNNKWETINITPGTKFMYDLKIGLDIHFNKYREEHPNMNIIFSCSDEYGEGEHKIYQYIRNNDEYHKNTNTIIYGLDADLIMLSLIHLNISENIYLFRETPHFIKYIDNSLNPYELYVLDIPLLGNHIIDNINKNGNKLSNTSLSQNKFNLIYDYILICFMLGNDFMPHFPSINIRCNGIDILLNAYKKFGKQLTNGKIIFWRNLRTFVNILASSERENMIKEVEHLNKYKQKNNNISLSTPISSINKYENDLLNLPSKCRDIENYINPNDEGWEYRYYKSLFNIEIDDVRRKQICINYLEGLEWTIKYYSNDCKNWRWKYNYDYAPLLTDLIKFIPYFDTNFIDEQTCISPINELTQLCYVLPNKYLNLLPDNIRIKLLQEHPEWYSNNFNIKWSFCKYFWESNIDLCDINIQELENILYENINKI